MTSSPRIVLHVDRVVLDGVPLDGHQRDQLRSALADELARRLDGIEPGPLLRGGGAVPRVRAAGVAVDPAGSPAALASQVAASVTAALAAGRPG